MRRIVKESGGKSLVSGAPIPEWHDLSKGIRAAWNQSAHAVREACVVAIREGEGPMDGIGD